MAHFKFFTQPNEPNDSKYREQDLHQTGSFEAESIAEAEKKVHTLIRYKPCQVSLFMLNDKDQLMSVENGVAVLMTSDGKPIQSSTAPHGYWDVRG